MAHEANERGYAVLRIRGEECMDHGTTVPLYFLQRNGWHGRVVALGYSFLSNDEHLGFGACVRRAADKVGRPVAFVASGDLSHRLKPEAPAGYNPRAHLFDEEVVGALRANCPNRIINLDQHMRRLAGECGYRSLLVALGATKDLRLSCEVLNYEAPFGVGYLVAQFLLEPTVVTEGSVHSAMQRESNSQKMGSGEQLPALARAAVETFVLHGLQIEAPDKQEGILAERAACFVSIKVRNGDLRGCIGTIEPAHG